MVFAAGVEEAHSKELAHQDVTVKHTVQSGENLHTITRKYIGTDILWQDNWKLNPQIDNPNNLKIGQELTIIKERIIPAEKALVFNVVNRVEKKPADSGWLSAKEGDELVQKEGVRTYGKSSTLLEFNDESQLKVLEYSQIFLQSRSTDLTGTDSATIEIIKGDAELNWEPIVADQTKITIVTGEMISKPEVTAGKIAELRTGISKAGKSLISVFQGNSEVANGGAEVDVEEGMGVAVKPGEIPVPKPLLKAPQVKPKGESVYNFSNPQLSWSAVKDAKEYLVEICADQACNTILKQATVQTNQWQMNDFNQLGTFYYRIGAKNIDELVGFRSEAQKFEIMTAVEDISAPVIAIELIGHKKEEDDKFIVGPDTQIKILAYDQLSGLAGIDFSWDGNEWQKYTDRPLGLPSGSSELMIRATDKLGLAAEQSYKFISQ